MAREALAIIQKKLEVPKNQFNKFGGYNYRSCEDILEAVKPLLEEVGATLTLSDSMVNFGDRFYVRSEAILDVEGRTIQTVSFAREAETRKGMTADQITGSASSYSRKYALNGLFLIDDSRDADSQEEVKPVYKTYDELVERIGECKAVPELENVWKKYKRDIGVQKDKAVLIKAMTDKKASIVAGLMQGEGSVTEEDPF